MSPTPDNKNQSEVKLLDVPDYDEEVVLVELDGENLRSAESESGPVLISQTADLMSDVVRSEVNFLVLPFFALWDKDVKRRTKTEYKAVIKRGRQKLEVSWTVLAQPEFGYPGPFDKKVHKAIEEIISKLPRPIQNPIPLGSFHNLQ